MSLFKFTRAQGTSDNTSDVSLPSGSPAASQMSNAVNTANAPLAQSLNPMGSIGNNAVAPATVNAPPMAPIIPKKQGITLFSDEQKIKNDMIAGGADDNTATSNIIARRKDLFGGDASILPKEAEMMKKMQADGVSAKDAVDMIKQRREDTGEAPGKTSLAQKAFNVSAGAASLATEQVFNALDFATGGRGGFKEDVQGLKEAIKPMEGQTGFQSGRNILGAGEYLGSVPMKLMTSAGIAPTIAGRMGQGAAVAGIQGLSTPILEKGSDTTAMDIAKSGGTNAALGALGVPAIEKVAAPIIGAAAKPFISVAKPFISGAEKLGNIFTKSEAPAIGSEIASQAEPAAKFGKNIFGEDVRPLDIQEPGAGGKVMESLSKVPVVGKAVNQLTGTPEGDLKSLVDHAIRPKFGKLTSREKLAVISDEGYTKDLEVIHGLVASGRIDGDLNSVMGLAETIEKTLQDSGAKIGQHLKNAGLDSKVDVSAPIASLDKIIADARGAESQPELFNMAVKYKKLLTKFDSLDEIQATKQDLFQDLTNIKKENVARVQYQNFVDAANATIKAIDTKVEQASGNSADFIKEKQIYKAALNLQKDATDSAMVISRKSPVSLAEQISGMASAREALTKPVAFAGGKINSEIQKTIAERASQDGSLRRAMKIFDQRAQARSEIAGKVGNAIPSAGSVPSAIIPKTKSMGNKSIDAIISEGKSTGVDMDKYIANASEVSANKMADHAYKYAIDSAIEGKNTLNFNRISAINQALRAGKEGKVATVGDIITDPYLRKLYKDALGTPIEVSNTSGVAGSIGEFVIGGPQKGSIIFRSGNTETEYNLADTLLHEAAHAIRSVKGRATVNDYAVPIIPEEVTAKKPVGKGIPKPKK